MWARDNLMSELDSAGNGECMNGMTRTENCEAAENRSAMEEGHTFDSHHFEAVLGNVGSTSSWLIKIADSAIFLLD